MKLNPMWIGLFLLVIRTIGLACVLILGACAYGTATPPTGQYLVTFGGVPGSFLLTIPPGTTLTMTQDLSRYLTPLTPEMAAQLTAQEMRYRELANEAADFATASIYDSILYGGGHGGRHFLRLHAHHGVADKHR